MQLPTVTSLRVSPITTSRVRNDFGSYEAPTPTADFDGVTTPAAAGPKRPSVTVERCSGLSHADEVKALFARNDRPGFAAFFDRNYGLSASTGGGSWIARDDKGTVVMHVAVFPRNFRAADRVVRVGLVGDLMADADFRNFWNPMQLFRRTIADLRRDGDFDCLYSDPSPNAVAIVLAAGFRPFGDLQRFALPLFEPYLALRALAAPRPNPALYADVREGMSPEVPSEVSFPPPSGHFLADRTVEFYASRVSAEGATRHVGIHCARTGTAMAGALVRSDDRLLNVLDLRWNERQTSSAAALLALGAAARRSGFRRVSLMTLVGSRLSEQVRAAGFLAREVVQPIHLLPLQTSVTIPPAAQWVLSTADGSAW